LRQVQQTHLTEDHDYDEASDALKPNCPDNNNQPKDSGDAFGECEGCSGGDGPGTVLTLSTGRDGAPF
jgi:hypothetical protein